MPDYKCAVIIGRFQPFHRGHMELGREALKIADHVVWVIGSHRSAPTLKNPWSCSQRQDMIQSAFEPAAVAQMSFIPVRDHYGNDEKWATEVKNGVYNAVGRVPTILLGAFKDKSSYYLDLFPNWALHPVKPGVNNATDIRAEYFDRGDLWFDQVHANVLAKMNEFQEMDTFKRLEREAQLKPRKSDIFVTSDAVVMHNGHVLLIRRKRAPGEGLLALPGGHLDPGETFEDCCLRELYEETGLKVDTSDILGSEFFDNPNRSHCARIITKAFEIDIDGEDLPDVKGGDDASEAGWYLIENLWQVEDEFHNDHFSIIQRFL